MSEEKPVIWNHASDIAWAWWDTEDANSVDRAVAGLLRRIRLDIISGPDLTKTEAVDAIMTTIPFDSFEEDGDGTFLNVDAEAKALVVALKQWLWLRAEPSSTI